MSEANSPEHPLSAVIREHPFLMQLYRRERVFLQGDRPSQQPVFHLISGDTELWVSETGPELYEGWGSERGQRRLRYRSNSMAGVVAALILDSTAALVFDLTPGCPYHQAPPRIAFESTGEHATQAVWLDEEGTERWIEFAGHASLATALEFARILVAPAGTLKVRALLAASRADGHSTRSICGPRIVDATVRQWRNWLATEPPCTWQGPKPVTEPLRR